MFIRRGENCLNEFKFGTFIGRFPSEGAASVAVKGLRSCLIPPTGNQLKCRCAFISSVFVDNSETIKN